jgi:transcriptional regulator with XRE-family HTH domain
MSPSDSSVGAKVEVETEVDGPRGGRTVTASLSRRLRAARIARGLSLRAVAEKAQISTSLLSQIERGKASPSLVSLVAIADALTIRPGMLLDDDEELATSPVVRREERHVVDDNHCRREYLMHLDDPLLEVAELLMRPGSSTRPKLASHSGRDYGIVLQGQVRIEFDSGHEELGEGDYIAFDASRPHRVVNETGNEARVIWIIAHERTEATAIRNLGRERKAVERALEP